MNTPKLSVKLFLIAAGAVSLAMGIRLSFPIAVSEVPMLWSMMQSWTKPPYLYIIFNGIIITIAASSRFQKVPTETQQTVRATEQTHLITVKSQQPDQMIRTESRAFVVYDESDDEVEERVVELRPVVLVNGSKLDDDGEIEEEEEESMADDEGDYQYEDVYVDTVFTHSATATEKVVSPGVRPEYLSPVMVKPPVASRIGRRKPNRTTPEGVRRPPRVARQQKHDTLESTWKKITEGRHVPLTMHVKNSDATEQLEDDYGSPQGYGIRKEVSPGQEELNRRVEEFIRKFKEDMRVQRQESLDKYLKMANRGD